MVKKASTKHFLQGLGRVLYHVLLVAMSAGVAFSLPTMVSIVARDFWTYWALVENRLSHLYRSARRPARHATKLPRSENHAAESGPDTPEYDLETDEIVYRDVTGNELKRKRFDASHKHDGKQGAGEPVHPASFTSLTYHHESSTRSGEADRGNAAVMEGGKDNYVGS